MRTVYIQPPILFCCIGSLRERERKKKKILPRQPVTQKRAFRLQKRLSRSKRCSFAACWIFFGWDVEAHQVPRKLLSLIFFFPSFSVRKRKKNMPAMTAFSFLLIECQKNRNRGGEIKATCLRQKRRNRPSSRGNIFQQQLGGKKKE